MKEPNNKVFCKYCTRYDKFSELYYESCFMGYTYKYNYYNRCIERIRANAQIKNRYNDCKDYKRKWYLFWG